MLKRVEAFIRENALLRRGDRLVVAVSGGVDSMVLLHLLCALREKEEWALALHVAHFDHRLRDRSAEDAAFVEAQAERLGLPVTVAAEDVRRYAREQRLSLEAAGRARRYAFLERVARAVGAGGVALGHTQDDQVETFLLHLLRGAGLTGLRGMLPRRGLYIRPLLACTRAQVEAYAARYRVPFRRDPSNRDLRFTRNRIRHRLLPLLREFNPNAVETLARAQSALREVSAYLEGQAQKELQALCVERGEAALALDRAALNRLPVALRTEVLRQALSRLMGDLRGFSRAHLEAVCRASQAEGSGAELHLPRGVRLTVEAHRLVIHRNRNRRSRGRSVGSADPAGPQAEVLKVPGTTPLPWGWRFQAQVRPLGPEDLARLPSSRDGLEAWMDYGKIVLPLRVRTRRPGDRIAPLGLGGTKKVQDVFVDAKVPRAQRDRWPLVVDRKGVIWVTGLCLAERVKVTPRTDRVLRLRACPAEPGPEPSAPESESKTGEGRTDDPDHPGLRRHVGVPHPHPRGGTLPGRAPGGRVGP